MSRNGSGVYSLPAGSTVTNGDTSDATDLNTPLADLEADMNVPRPVVAGGTGASSASAALVNLGLTATAAEINVLDGVTASTAELNVLDGITATVAELNYTDGVTSAIQTQLDAKQALDADLTAIAATGVTTSHIAAATLVTAAETIASNDNDTTIPTSAAVKAYADGVIAGLDIPAAIAALAAGAVGSYGFFNNGANTVAFGSTLAGSNLNPADSAGNTTASARSGTWRCMGKTDSATVGERTTLWLRIS